MRRILKQRARYLAWPHKFVMDTFRMARHRFSAILVLLAVIALGGVPGFAAPLMQQDAAALVVTGVIIDKTAANAVLAREEAMADARRAAFRKLAQAHLTPEAATDLPLPDDATLAALVQDIEIKRERLSSTRYVGDFTVRFREGVRSYIPLPPASVQTAEGPAAVLAVPALDQKDAAPRTGQLRLSAPVLILPYLQDISGQMLLWGEPNPWRQAWQTAPPQARGLVSDRDAAAAEGKVIVPLGDISDVAAGPDSAVWSGNYTAVEALRANYAVETVILAVANRSGPQVRVDLYDYTGGSLHRRGRLEPVIDPALDADAVFAAAARATLQEILTAPQRAATQSGASLERISRDVVADGPASGGAPAAMVVSGGGIQVQAGMRFEDFMTWMQTQKKLADIVPPVRVNIQTISREQARFILEFQGDMQVLTALLAEQGLHLTPGAGTSDYTLVLTP